MEIDTKGIQEIRCEDNKIIFRYGTHQQAWDAHWKQFKKTMDEVDMGGIFD